MEEAEELLVRRQTTEQRSIETVHGLAETPEEQTADESPCGSPREARLLLDECFIVCLAASHDFDLCDVGL